MCIRDRDWAREKVEAFYLYQFKSLPRASAEQFELPPRDRIIPCLLYTSDAADERSSVDLGGRRIIKKKKQI